MRADRLLVSGLVLSLWSGAALAIVDDDPKTGVSQGSPIADALASVSPEVREYNDHLVTLANPYMMGRVPGSAGMERAMDYVEYHFRQYGLEPAFPTNLDGVDSPFTSYRDPFALGGLWKVQSESLQGGAAKLTPEKDFVFTALGGSGEVSGDAVFVGYSIENGPDGWSSYGEEDDLTGKVAVMFRFEPTDEEGKSTWTEGGEWSGRSSFANKLRGAASRGAAAAVVINPPWAADQRAQKLDRFQSGGGGDSAMPVLMVSPEGAKKLLAGADGRTLEDLRAIADAGGGAVDLGVDVKITGNGEREELAAQNVGCVIKGSGSLADEWIVVGGHLDHIGMGYFGSRAGPGTLHPGADDNASSAAGLILLSKKLSESIAEMSADAPRRSILIIEFSGEESGLNGSHHYVEHPIVPLDKHALMINWDMIGRIKNERLTVAGVDTAKGMREFLQPFFDESGLEITVPDSMNGASDHTSFYMKDIPVLFSIITDFHEDYHTPGDVSWKINRVGAVKTVDMYHDIILAAAQRPERFEFVKSERQAPQAPAAGLKVRLGVMPGSYDPNERGIPIASVSDNGPAQKAGMLDGDRLVRWDGQKIGDVQHWIELLSKHEPGDVVKVGVLRDGEEITLTVTLEAR
ncbi:MAG: M28 family peptidase [Phycisphaerales bacterium]